MEQRELPVMGSVMVVILALAAWLLVGRLFKSDVVFCRGILQGLAEGNVSVASQIDWERLKAVGVDVGATYRSLTTSQDQQRYQRMFVQKFAEGFRQAGGRLAAGRVAVRRHRGVPESGSRERPAQRWSP